MKIIILTSEFPPGPGGIGDHAFNLSEELQANGFEVLVLSEMREEFREKWANIKPAATVNYFRRRKIFPNIELIFSFLYHFLKHKDALWIASGTRSLMILGSALYLFRRKSIAILHGHELLLSQRFKTWLTRKVVGKFNKAIAVSDFSKNNSLPFIKEENKIVVFPNGFNAAKYGDDLPPRRPAPNGNLNLLTVGRISLRKGQHNVVKALPEIVKKYPRAVYHIVGMDGSSADLKGLTKSLNMEGHVRIHGVLSDKELATVLKNTDIFLMLSENRPGGDVEGFGIAIVEANFFGIPAIGSTGCGVEQAIKDGFSGRLLDLHGNEGLTDAITSVIENYEQYSLNALRWSGEHSWSNVIKRYITVISEMKEVNGASRFFSVPANYLRKDFNVLVRKKFVRSFVGNISSKSILDVGCGDGRISLQFALNNRLTLVDASKGMLDLARTNTPVAASGNVNYVLAKLEAAPLTEEGYDLIIAMGILAHLDSWKEGLKLLAGSLRKGGRIVIQISDGANWLVRAQLNPSGNRLHKLNKIEVNTLVKQCAEIGLVKTEMKRYGFSVRGMGLLPNRLLYYCALGTSNKIFNSISTEAIIVFEKR